MEIKTNCKYSIKLCVINALQGQTKQLCWQVDTNTLEMETRGGNQRGRVGLPINRDIHPQKAIHYCSRIHIFRFIFRTFLPIHASIDSLHCVNDAIINQGKIKSCSIPINQDENTGTNTTRQSNYHDRRNHPWSTYGDQKRLH